ncbi:hypothetical protein [Amycolatopsis vastitatis]|nr:hypothetical protein [Amycolatopsis vastitatis]
MWPRRCGRCAGANLGPPGWLAREWAAGTGASLNVAVAGSLGLYKLAGLL